MRSRRKIQSVLLTTTALALSALAFGTAAEADPMSPESLSQCPTGYMCIWSGTNYTGTIQKFSTAGKYSPILLSASNSLYNHRSKRTYFHEESNGSGIYTCLDPGKKKASLSGWSVHAEAVWLSTTTGC